MPSSFDGGLTVGGVLKRRFLQFFKGGGKENEWELLALSWTELAAAVTQANKKPESCPSGSCSSSVVLPSDGSWLGSPRMRSSAVR